MVQTGRADQQSWTRAARRAALLVAVSIALAVLASSGATHQALLNVLGAARTVIEQHAFLGPVAFVVLAALSAMLTFVSIAVVVPAAVFAWGAPASIAMLWLGWILGGAATYGVGRYLGRQAVHWPNAERVVHELEGHLSADTPLWFIVLLQLALPSEIPGYFLGLVRYPLPRYLIALAVAELPYTVATVYLGDSFVQGRSGLILVIGALLALGSICAVRALRRHLREAI
jgi:uncharacterized membrane protein YdjX (TVP38/TMEM64 family)